MIIEDSEKVIQISQKREAKITSYSFFEQIVGENDSTCFRLGLLNRYQIRRGLVWDENGSASPRNGVIDDSTKGQTTQ